MRPRDSPRGEHGVILGQSPRGLDWSQAINSLSLSDKYAAARAYDVNPDGSGIYAVVCETNHPLRLTQAELEAHPRWRGFGKERERHPPMRGWLAVPLVGPGGGNLGLIQLSDRYEDEFTETDETILVQLAQMASVVLLIQRSRDELTAANEQLAAANKEMESFSYSVSHDLRAPLRAIDGFSRILQQDFAEALPQDARRHLSVVRQSAQQMARLIDDLLAFSRLGRQALKKQTVNTDRLVRKVLDELCGEHQGRVLDVRIGTLPPCMGDEGLLKQVWLNLLGNAIKYTRKHESAVIEIGSQVGTDRPGGTVYYVRDNGVGFDMQYVHKLFGVFQRLHRSADFEGTGVGLAIVQRIVHRHDGRVWAEAKPGQGATFFFTLE